ncbi:MAG: hypothetical protein LUC33_04295 [Prevotellaceae bacterium]|nr:hypothetical protein [Prevotellaceae bacterium]
MKRFLILCLAALSLEAPCLAAPTNATQERLDTVYYDKNWKCITTPAFASYYRVMAKTSDTTAAKPYRGFYHTGELQAEGEYISFDKDDDTKSVYDGDYEFFYKSGQTAEKGSWKDGKRTGEFITYNENGLMLKHLYYSEGELNGICTEFNEDGTTCVQTEYSNGQPSSDYYVMSNSAGQCSMISLTDGKPIYENPTPSDMQVEYLQDQPWMRLDKNGLSIGVNLDGWGTRISIIVVNNSMFPIDISSENVSLTFENAKKSFPVKVYSFSEMSQKLQKSQAWASVFNAVGETMAASQAGKSSSSTTTAWAGATGGIGYSGVAASATTSYNGAAAYQAKVIASDRISAYNNTLLAERQAQEADYLKKTTLQPGESISGYLYAKTNDIWKVKAGIFTIDVNINSVTYEYKWDLEYVKRRIKIYPVTE